MINKRFPLVIIGEVDHGKSTLIGRLLLETNSLPKDKITEIKKISRQLGKDIELAFLTDQLKEEREQNKTIDTTQIFLKTRKRNYVLIDTPGHVEFIRNMVTGASQAEAAILLVDATSGIQDQTRLHAYLICLLGIKNIIIALNKIDLIDKKKTQIISEELKTKLSKIMADVGATNFCIIPVSAKYGINISKKSSLTRWYKGPCLLAAIDSLKPKKQISKIPLRLPIQDIYKINGEIIIVGKLSSSTIKQGQTVRLFPSLKDVRIKSIKIFEKNITKAYAGENIGLILDKPFFAKRGEVIASKEYPLQPTNYFKGNIFWMSDEPLGINTPLIFRCANQEIPCIAEHIEKAINPSTLVATETNIGMLKLNEIGVVLFKTENPVAIEEFNFIEELGRFVVEKNNTLQGIGIITQILPPKET